MKYAPLGLWLVATPFLGPFLPTTIAAGIAGSTAAHTSDRGLRGGTADTPCADITIEAGHLECGNPPLQSDYRGPISYTKSGLTCQSWSSQTPHAHINGPEKWPLAGLADNNHCRNPDEDSGGAWCYTTDPDVRYAYCDVPVCSEESEDEEDPCMDLSLAADSACEDDVWTCMKATQTAAGVFEGHLSAARVEHERCVSLNECAEISTCEVAVKAVLSCLGNTCSEESEDEEDPCMDLFLAADSVCEDDVWTCMKARQTAEGVFEGHLSAAEEEHEICVSLHQCAETSACYVATTVLLSCYGNTCFEESEDEEDSCKDLYVAAHSACEDDVLPCMNDRQTAEGVFEGHLSAAEEEHAVCASVHECAETSACYA